MAFLRNVLSSVVNGYESPDCEVLEKTEVFEKRKYKKSVWMTTPGTDSNASFKKLFRYITGQNEEGTQVAMTIPVVMDYVPSDEGPCVMNKMSFFLPHKFHSNVPQPKEEGLKKEDHEEKTYYVTRFGGYAKPEDWNNNYEKLKKAMIDSGAPEPKCPGFYAVGYDSPMNFINRRNEVWIEV